MPKMPLHYQRAALSPEVERAFAHLVDDPIGLVTSDAAAGRKTVSATIDPGKPGLSSFAWDGQHLSLTGGSIPALLRALTLFRGYEAAGDIPAAHSERTSFESIGLMFDVSRNAVATVGTVKLFLRKMALLGMNQFMLYTEDTYEVPEQPLIGYLRGRYSQAELREIDAYAADLGIEVIPCIQALAHLAQMLRWPAFGEVSDTPDILLVDEPKTYELLEQMLAAATAPYRSKRIHLGMDEAHQIGLGKYRERYGIRPRFEILSTHLQKVSAICDKLGLQPMIWSDMYFRLASSTGDYYSPDARITPEVVPNIPPKMQLVYWDYYHTDPAFYRDWIERHEVAGRDTLFAAGLWTWNTFWSIVSWTRITSEAGIRASREKGIKEVFTTAWGDDGGEADFLSILLGLTHFAANAYAAEGVADEAKLRRDFRGACDGDWDAWLANGKIDHTPGLPTLREIWGGATPTDVPPHLTDTTEINFSAANVAKTMLWQDPLLGVIDGNLLLEWGLEAHYRALTRELESLHNKETGWSRHAFPLAIARALSEKAELGKRLHEAYQRRDRATLQQIHDVRLPAALAACEALHEAHRQLWFELYKPHGWEVIDGRYGTLLARLRSTRLRLGDFLAGRLATIDELESPRLPVMPWVKGKLGHSATHKRVSTPSVI